MLCLYCSSSNFVRNGRDSKGVQRYKCNDCKRRFCEKGIFAKHRFSKEIIIDAIYLRSYPLSLRDVKRVMRRLKQTKVSHVSIYNWILKFAPKLIELAKRIPIQFTKIWHVDEKFIKVKKSKDDFAYLWAVIDSNNNLIAVHVSNKRDKVNAKIVFNKAKERAGFSPDILASDGLQGYKKAASFVFGRKTKHIIAHFKKKGLIYLGKRFFISNNRIERVNEFFALWLHVCRGLKSFETANLWLEFFAVHYNYLMPHGKEEKVKVEWEEVPIMMGS